MIVLLNLECLFYSLVQSRLQLYFLAFLGLTFLEKVAWCRKNKCGLCRYEKVLILKMKLLENYET